MGRRATIADVAQKAGVSMMTVSRVLNDTGPVSAITRQRIIEVIDDLGYRPSGIARSLATARTGTIGLVVPDIANPFFSSIASGVEAVAHASEHNVFLCNTGEDAQREGAVLNSLEEKRVDGLVLCSSRLDDDALAQSIRPFLAVVLVNRQLSTCDTRTVLVDDEAGAALLTRHLLKSGHHHIGMIAGPVNSRSDRLRRRGFQKTLEAAGLSYHPRWLISTTPAVEGGFEAATHLLQKHKRISALMCYNDLVAVGALQASYALGISVPDDLAITGFDDIHFSRLVTPSLTTCRVDSSALGALAMQRLLERFSSEDIGDRADLIAPKLIIRERAVLKQSLSYYCNPQRL